MDGSDGIRSMDFAAESRLERRRLLVISEPLLVGVPDGLESFLGGPDDLGENVSAVPDEILVKPPLLCNPPNEVRGGPPPARACGNGTSTIASEDIACSDRDGRIRVVRRSVLARSNTSREPLLNPTNSRLMSGTAIHIVIYTPWCL